MNDITSAKERIIKKASAVPATKEVLSELVLPDYLPDVSRLLRTEATLGAINSYASGGQVEYDGKIDHTVVFATSDGRIKSIPLSAEFEGELSAPDISGDVVTDVDVLVESVNCRLQNPRRLTVRTKLAVGADIYSPESVVPRLTGDGGEPSDAALCRKYTPVCSVFRVYANDENVPVSEDLELDAQDPNVSEIVSVSLTPFIYDVRATEGNISYRGDVLAQVIYLASSDDGDERAEYYSITRKIPVSGDVAADGVSDGAPAAGFATVSAVEYRPQANAVGENRVIEVDFTYTAHLVAAMNETAEAVRDIYSTERESSTEMKTAANRRAVKASSFNFTADGAAALDDKNHSEVVASSAVVSIDDVAMNGSKAVFSGTAEVYVILTDGKGSYIGRSVPMNVRAETDAGKYSGELDCKAYPSVIGVSARVDGGEIKCEAEIGISYIAEDVSKTEITDVCMLGAERTRGKTGASSIVICYPGESDTLWDIAKRYGTTEQSLRESNGITSESVSGKVIIIPTPEK